MNRKNNTKVKLSLPSITPKQKEFLVFLCGLLIAAVLIEIILVCGFLLGHYVLKLGLVTPSNIVNILPLMWLACVCVFGLVLRVFQ